MNARFLPDARIEAVPYSSGSYVMTEADLPSNVVGTIHDCERAVIHKPYRAVIWLNVPLCSGCDQPIVDHQCADCELVFIGTPPTWEGIEA